MLGSNQRRTADQQPGRQQPEHAEQLVVVVSQRRDDPASPAPRAISSRPGSQSVSMNDCRTCGWVVRA